MIYVSYVFNLLEKEQMRQDNNVELIASENFVSKNILRALGSEFTNKYTEGYPPIRFNNIGRKGRYYGGCQYYDVLEEYCCAKWREVFKTNYHVNVQPHSGSSANMAVYRAFLDYGDPVLTMSLADGGHLSHGASVSFSGKDYDICHYTLTPDGLIDYGNIELMIKRIEPKLIVVGASAYSREIDYKRIATIINKCSYTKEYTDPYSREIEEYTYRPIYMVDMAHVAGLIAAGYHQSPFGYADVITTTTHKTLRGPRGGLIFCKPEYANKIDSAVFPGIQGGSLMNVIAAKAICAEEALTPAFKEYIGEVVNCANTMANYFIKLGYEVISGGTDNHMFLLSLKDTGITGKELQDYLDEYNYITLNKNAIPNDPLPPGQASGVRIGTPAMVTKGWRERDFLYCANEINNAILKLSNRKAERTLDKYFKNITEAKEYWKSID